MSNIVKAGQKAVLKSDSGSGAAGKALVVTGGTGLGLWFLAGLLPFITLPMLLVAMVVVGFFMWE